MSSQLVEVTENEEGALAVQELLKLTGRTFIYVNNPWFTSQKFGEWERWLFCDLRRGTDKAVLPGRVTWASDAVADYVRHKELAQESDCEVVPPGYLAGNETAEWDELDFEGERASEYLMRAVRKTAGEFDDRFKEEWLPRSAIGMMVSHEGPEQFVEYSPDGATREVTKDNDADAVVLERCHKSTEWSQYEKLAVDCDYEVGQVVSDLEWEALHPSAKYHRGEFVCWTVDPKVRKFVGKMNEQGYSVAVHKRLL